MSGTQVNQLLAQGYNPNTLDRLRPVLLQDAVIVPQLLPHGVAQAARLHSLVNAAKELAELNWRGQPHDG